MIKFFVKWVLFPILLVIAYLGFFAYNTVSGGYFLEPAADGTDEGTTFGIKKAILWQPKHGFLTADKSDFLGSIYAPLIKLDRKLIHPTHYAGEKGFVDWLKSLPKDEIHPGSPDSLEKVQGLLKFLPGS